MQTNAYKFRKVKKQILFKIFKLKHKQQIKSKLKTSKLQATRYKTAQTYKLFLKILINMILNIKMNKVKIIKKGANQLAFTKVVRKH